MLIDDVKANQEVLFWTYRDKKNELKSDLDIQNYSYYQISGTMDSLFPKKFNDSNQGKLENPRENSHFFDKQNLIHEYWIK